MSLKVLDNPLVFWIVMTILVVAMAHLLHMGANAAGWNGLANFFSLPETGTNGGK